MAMIKANYGRSTFVSWNDTTLDLIDIDSGGITASTEVIESTRYGDSIRQFLPGYTNYGSISITVSTDRSTDVANLRRNFRDRVVGAFTVVLPTGLKQTYNGFITSFTDYLDKHGLYTLKLTIQLSGGPQEIVSEPYTIIPVNGSDMYKGSSYGLFLALGAAATEATTGGEGAVWEITTTERDAQTQIIGNTLYISPMEQKNTIGVKATIYPTEASTQAATATYHIVAPSATAVQISGAAEITYSLSQEEDTTSTYTATVYPSGASQTVVWTLKKSDGSNPEAGITISGGVVRISHTQYQPEQGTYYYIIQAATTTGAVIANVKYISVVVNA